MKTKLIFGITVSRVLIAPVLFGLLQNPQYHLLIWLCFILIELSDIFDGHVARKWGLTSDLGKLLDPLCDVLSRGALLFTLAFLGVISPIVMLLIFYRETIMLGFRMLMVKRHRVVAANLGGKVKTFLYSLSIGLGIYSLLYGGMEYTVLIVSWLAALSSWASLLYYLLQSRKKAGESQKDR